MACKKVHLRGEEQKHRNDVAESMEPVVSDTLLFATMCIVGMCVDVHTKDGSVFCGMFYTCSVDKDYAIVLKNASLIKKGNLDGNVANVMLVETLIIRSDDLVQVVAKSVQLPSNGISGFVGGDRAEIKIHYGEESLENNEKPSWNKKQKSENRQVHNGFQRRQSDNKLTNNNREVKDQVQGVHDLRRSKDATMRHAQDTPTSIGMPRSTVDSNDISIPSFTNEDITSESRFGMSPKPYMLSPKKGSGFEKNTKDSKLNPGAKVFSPSMFNMRISSPIMPSGANLSYMSGTYAMAPLISAQEVDESSFSHSPVPVKYVPHNNITSGNVGYGASYAQPMIGQVVTRGQQVRYGGLYQQVPSALAYSQQSPQNVMIGLAEPVFAVHPVAGNASGFSPASLHPQFPLHQGNTTHLAMNQPSVPAPIMASPPPPVFPILHPTIIQRSKNHASIFIIGNGKLI